jgi:hypothetical protein
MSNQRMYESEDWQIDEYDTAPLENPAKQMDCIKAPLPELLETLQGMGYPYDAALALIHDAVLETLK